MDICELSNEASSSIEEGRKASWLRRHAGRLFAVVSDPANAAVRTPLRPWAARLKFETVADIRWSDLALRSMGELSVEDCSALLRMTPVGMLALADSQKGSLMSNVKALAGAALSAVLLAAATSASAGVVNFNDVPTDGMFNPVSSRSISDGGLTFSNTGYAYIINNAFGNIQNANDGSVFYVDGLGATTITANNHGVFSLDGLDAGLSFYGGAWGSVTITGYKSGGGTVSQTLKLNDSFKTYTLTGFDDLTSAKINTGGGYIALDNLVLGVPEPATWTLLILGLGMIGFAARRRTARDALAA